MPVERIGWRRLYNALGCSTLGDAPFSSQIALGNGIFGSIYLGPRPRFGVVDSPSAPGYIVPGAGEQHIFDLKHSFDPSEVSIKASLLTEITCWKEVDVQAAVSEPFWLQDRAATMSVLNLANALKNELEPHLDLLAGTLGLRIHMQFVLKVIAEHPVALRQPGQDGLQFSGPTMQLLEQPILTMGGRQTISSLLRAIGTCEFKTQREAGIILGWLLRAWQEHDPVVQFLSLFIPLEMCLAGVSPPKDPRTENQILLLRSLLPGLSETDAREADKFLSRASANLRPSITSRFEELAKRARLPSQDVDIEAFSFFNRVRNALIHRGNKGVKLFAKTEPKARGALRDLVERYVSYDLFGDGFVYADRWRDGR